MKNYHLNIIFWYNSFRTIDLKRKLKNKLQPPVTRFSSSAMLIFFFFKSGICGQFISNSFKVWQVNNEKGTNRVLSRWWGVLCSTKMKSTKKSPSCNISVIQLSICVCLCWQPFFSALSLSFFLHPLKTQLVISCFT